MLEETWYSIDQPRAEFFPIVWAIQGWSIAREAVKRRRPGGGKVRRSIASVFTLPPRGARILL
ncbi:hypothetical protein LDO26_06405 [Luteimonas sp. BDR2-5]|uniref:hypothetical protein n=1 Tax=Proluteimonas luteida TaxID=2878685 RepID=UPI001E428E7E|nr:hypothetical protein [Luteimonas sp. BDR2-5]MCD9027834.1 hypothetical protein [Luteimonas sp. BDR2-5]